MAELLAALYDFRGQLVLWTGGYILLYALASNLSFLIRESAATRWQRIISPLEQGIPGAILGFAFYIGLPYLALLLGITNPQLMGLLPQDWIPGLGISILFGLGGFFLLFVLWFFYLRSLRTREVQKVNTLQSINRFATLWSVIQFQAHWAFLRSAPLLLFGEYHGVFLGFGLFLLERGTNPYLRRGLFQEGQEKNLHIASLALISAIAFYFTQNLWLTAALHLAIELSLWGLLRKIMIPYQETNLQRVSA
ncbi:MAG: hypothetical protein HYX86_02435 [Chloroflexi bacterium]|nr:hypothetical protein [Chloroflexota bacterium]